ncbi:hypothetical protein TI39_contig4150g00008 [Zymoseptoria brevis]|uniref:Glycosyl transferase CAP10 domain-containing protein n=1 Tax=Zymoseptoria brevis TaxID=1047168 RepID=A0A0F4GC26_9PEZI|nr:hypothetical protein TI39_contig4150g00008 [Zymoseptoria brevis]
MKSYAQLGMPYLRAPTMRTVPLYATSIILTTAIIIVLFSIRGPPSLDFLDTTPLNSAKKHPDEPLPVTQSGWSFDFKRDARNFGLDEEQCLAAFPDFYKEIDRALQYRREVAGKIKPEELEVDWRPDGMMRAMIHDNQLYIIDAHGLDPPNHRARAIATLNAIQRALTASAIPLPDIEFTFSVHDDAHTSEDDTHTTWAYSRKAHQTSLWLMPDFGLWAWPDVNIRSYSELRTQLALSESHFLDKIPKLVWRGSLAVGSHDVRAGLVEHAANQPWSDVMELDWSDKSNINSRLLSMSDHCEYMFVAQTEGNTYSGRLKFLLNCHSILFSHKLDWIENYHHLMQPTGELQNFVQVKRDYSDLPKKITRLLDPKEVQRTELIADNARKIFRERYLTPAAEACYWRALIRGWASVQDFEPSFWWEVTETTAEGKTLKWKPRGTPFESYAIMEEVEWELPAKGRRICIDKDEEEKAEEPQVEQAQEPIEVPTGMQTEQQGDDLVPQQADVPVDEQTR